MKNYWSETEVRELLRQQRIICADRAVIDYAEPDKLAALTLAPEPDEFTKECSNDEMFPLSIVRKAFEVFHYRGFPHNEPTWQQWCDKNLKIEREI